MYNGIGLASVRGTATSGHVQQNAGHVRNARRQQTRTSSVFNHDSSERRSTTAPLLTAEALQDGASSLALHEKKRQLEVRLLELRDRLEERGWDENRIESEVERERGQTLDRWAREEDDRKRRETPVGGEQNKLIAGEAQGETNGGGEQTHNTRRDRDPWDHRNYDRGHGRHHHHQDSDYRRKGKGGKNAHQQQVFKDERNKKLRDAFSISEQRHKEGTQNTVPFSSFQTSTQHLRMTSFRCCI